MTNPKTKSPLEISFVTTNLSKFEILSDLAKNYPYLKLKRLDYEISEIQNLDTESVVRSSVEFAFNLCQHPVICEDRGLYIDSLNGYPGALVKYFDKFLDYNDILILLADKDNRKAHLKASVGYFDGVGIPRIFSARLDGEIATKPAGQQISSKIETLFIPTFKEQTIAQLYQTNRYLALKSHFVELLDNLMLNL